MLSGGCSGRSRGEVGCPLVIDFSYIDEYNLYFQEPSNICLQKEVKNKMWRNDKVKLMLALVGAAMLAYSSFELIFGERASAQNDQYLSRRIDQIEQRFYSIESRINRIESESRRPAIASPLPVTTSDTEMQFLRSQVDGLRQRLGEVECGLLRVDERTLARSSRSGLSKGTATGTNPCRQDTAEPVKLSARP
jgi:hypothetical protein